jgi:hypothetical protein
MRRLLKGFTTARRALAGSVILACPVDPVGVAALVGGIGIGVAYFAMVAVLFLPVVQAIYPAG